MNLTSSGQHCPAFCPTDCSLVEKLAAAQLPADGPSDAEAFSQSPPVLCLLSPDTEVRPGVLLCLSAISAPYPLGNDCSSFEVGGSLMESQDMVLLLPVTGTQ